MLPFLGLSVCLSVMFVHCAQTAEDIDTIAFAYDSPICLSQITLKFSLHRSTLPTLILSQSDPSPVDLSVRDIRWQLLPNG